MYLIGLISGLILLALIFHDTFEVMLLPRRVRRKLRFVTLLFRYTWNLWSWIAERMALGSRRDMFLSLYGPLSLVMLLGSCVKAGEKVHQSPERKYVSLRGRGNRGLVSGRGSARETVCEVNRQRSMIGAELEQTNEFGVEALR
jgi:hypothetical protein